MFEPENETNQNSFLGTITGAGLFLWDFLKVVIIAFAIILPIRYFLFQPFIVSGSSMEPNYSNGEYLIIDEASFRFREPVRGEVVVLVHHSLRPGQMNTDSTQKNNKDYYIKRLIGLPGEKVQVDNGRVIIYNDQNPEGVTLQEPYLPNQGLTFPHNTELIGGRKTITLGTDEYFVMGDNRLASSDSRDWGVLKRSDMVGRVFLRALPLNEFGMFQAPEYSY